MGCFLTVTRADFEQIKYMRGVTVVGNRGSDLRIKAANAMVAAEVREAIVQKRLHQAQETEETFKHMRNTSGEEEVLFEDARSFGRFAHEAYRLASYYHFDDVDSEVSVVVTKPDGTEAQGWIDTLIDDRIVIDYKTNDMRDWSEEEAIRHAHEYGRQVQEYVEATGMPPDACGWIIATVPPESEEVAQKYSEILAEYDIKVKFCTGEDQAAVLKAVQEAVKDSS